MTDEFAVPRCMFRVIGERSQQMNQTPTSLNGPALPDLDGLSRVFPFTDHKSVLAVIYV